MSYVSGETSVGELDPAFVMQQDERACLSAALLSAADRSLDLAETDITTVLSESGLYIEGVGTGLYAAEVLDDSARQFGLRVGPGYDARLPVSDEGEAIAKRVARVQEMLRAGQSVLLAFPKIRPENTFLHYARVTGCTGFERGDSVVLMDPSEIDGGVEQLTWEEFLPYVTPQPGVPVMAWGLSQVSGESIIQRPKPEVEDLGRVGLSLLTEPLWKPSDTGVPVPPGTRHAASVAMPTADITNQFVELGDIVLSRHGKNPHGYPRYVPPPAIKELATAATGQSDSLPFPTRQTAEAAASLELTYGDGAVIREEAGLFWLPDSYLNRSAWQHTGLGISSRQADAAISGRPENDHIRRTTAERGIKAIIERHTGAEATDIYLFPTGMAAIYWLNQALIKSLDGLPAIEFGFPYADTHEQRKYGPNRTMTSNLLDFRDGNYERLQELVLSGQRLRGLLTEYPSNPLLTTPDFDRLDAILGSETSIIIDDTIGTMFNLDDTKLPPSVAARVTSLTKFFSSAGNVMGGSVVLRPESPHYERLKQALEGIYEDTLWHEDAEVLAHNGQQFASIMPVINNRGSELAEWLVGQWSGVDKTLKTVYYPSINGTQNYDRVRAAAGGYGGLMTLRFSDSERGYRFFDRLRVTKGPGLGTMFTLGCLYTQLAHSLPTLASIEGFGVTPDLIRLSVGIEDVDDLKQRFSEAFAQSADRQA